MATDATGEYRFDTVLPGSYDWVAFHDDFAPTSPVVVEADRVSVVGGVQLEPGGALDVIVENRRSGRHRRTLVALMPATREAPRRKPVLWTGRRRLGAVDAVLVPVRVQAAGRRPGGRGGIAAQELPLEEEQPIEER